MLRNLDPVQRAGGLMPELVGVKTCQADEFQEKVEWMMARGCLTEAPNYAEVVRRKYRRLAPNKCPRRGVAGGGLAGAN